MVRRWSWFRPAAWETALSRKHSPFFWRDDLDNSAPHAVLFDPLDESVKASVAFKVFHRRFKHGHALEAASPAVSSLGSGGSGIVRLVVVVRRPRFRQSRRLGSLDGAGRFRFAKLVFVGRRVGVFIGRRRERSGVDKGRQRDLEPVDRDGRLARSWRRSRVRRRGCRERASIRNEAVQPRCRTRRRTVVVFGFDWRFLLAL